jgi:hypothetical protein
MYRTQRALNGRISRIANLYYNEQKLYSVKVSAING